MYGRGADPAALTVDWRDLRAALTTDKGLNALRTVKVDGKSTKAVVKELQRHPVRRDVLHVDFLAVDVDVAFDIAAHFSCAPKIASCISQNLPCSPAQLAASAALEAL